MTEHTPTPWKFSPNSFGTQFIYGDLETPRQSPMGVTYFHLVAGGDHPGTLTEANAAFIVKAANNHDALVTTLRDFIDILDGAMSGFIPGCGSDVSWHKGKDERIANARALLAGVGSSLISSSALSEDGNG